MFIGQIKPFKNLYSNYIELIFECFVLFVAYVTLILLTVPKPEQMTILGNICIALVSMFLGPFLFIQIFLAIRSIYRSVRR